MNDELVIEWADGESIALPLPSPTGISSIAGSISGTNLTITIYMTDGSSHAFTTPLNGIATEGYVDDSIAALATVARTGVYSDLTGKPDLSGKYTESSETYAYTSGSVLNCNPVTVPEDGYYLMEVNYTEASQSTAHYLLFGRVVNGSASNLFNMTSTSYGTFGARVMYTAIVKVQGGARTVGALVYGMFTDTITVVTKCVKISNL